MFDEKAFVLLKNVLLEAYRLSICYFPDWQNSIVKIDGGLRKTFTNSEAEYEQFRQLLPVLQPGGVLCLTDSFLYQYILKGRRLHPL